VSLDPAEDTEDLVRRVEDVSEGRVNIRLKPPTPTVPSTPGYHAYGVSDKENLSPSSFVSDASAATGNSKAAAAATHRYRTGLPG